MQLTRINDLSVKPVPQLIGGGKDNRPIKGRSLFPEPYANIFVCAKKKSGKSTVLFKILEECSGPRTEIIAFVSTLNKDSNWLNIQEYCRQRGLGFTGYTSLKDGKRDLIDEFIEEQQAIAEKDQEAQQGKSTQQVKPKHNLVIRTNDDEESELGQVYAAEQPPKREKSLAPEYILIFDDLSNELKSKSLVRLLKSNRHYKAKCVVSSQYLNDLLPESRKQMDYFLIFKSFPQEKLKIIYKDADLGIPFSAFESLYKYATQEDYSFLYVNTRTEEFRKNFNIRLRISLAK